MRWNCPHCGVSLAVSEEKVNEGWSFSRCISCNGFALVRRAEVNTIKVDHAPKGERVLLPNAIEQFVNSREGFKSENPVMMLSQKAINALKAPRPAKPEVKPAQRARTASAPQVMASAGGSIGFSGTAPVSRPPLFHSMGQVTESVPSPMTMFALPEPLPSVPMRAWYFRILPVGIGVATALMIGSGIYLYIEGQALWRKARSTRPVAQQAVAVNPTSEQRTAVEASSEEMVPVVEVNPGQEP